MNAARYTKRADQLGAAIQSGKRAFVPKLPMHCVFVAQFGVPRADLAAVLGA